MYRAIVVDDEPFMLEGMRLMIRWSDCGFELVGTAGTAQDALKLIEQVKPELVITDIRMPGLLGTDLAELLHKEHPEIVLLFFSGYRDFSYAQAAIRSHVFGYLLKPIDSDEVHEVLSRIKDTLDERRAQQNKPAQPLLREHVLRRLAFGDDSQETLEQCAKLLHILPNETVYCAAITSEYSLTPDYSQLESLLGAAGAVCFALAPELLGVMLRSDAKTLPLERLKQMMRKSQNADLYIGAGCPGTGAVGFKQSLRQAMAALGPWYQLDDGLRRYRPYEKGLAVWLYNAEQIALVEAIKHRDTALVDTLLHKLGDLYREHKPELFYLRVMAKNMETVLSESTDEQATAAFYKLWQSESLTGEEWITVYSNCVRDAMKDQGAQADETPEPVRQVLKYIEKEYAGNASIGEIAKRLYLNPAYLGQLVRKHTGETFHHHLLSIRMQKACALLRQTSLPLSQIASEVGVRDVDYFSQQFRAYMDMSPNTYRSAVPKGGERA